MAARVGVRAVVCLLLCVGEILRRVRSTPAVVIAMATVAGMAALIGEVAPAVAEGAPMPRPQEPRTVYSLDADPYYLWRETWGGAEVQSQAWSVYTGSTVALTGDIEGPGWRLRTTGGYGQYTYRRWINGPAGPTHARFRGRKVFSELLVGYQMQWQRLTLKGFGGLVSEHHIVDPRDPDNAVEETSYGAKGALEAWLAISDQHWVAGTMSFATGTDTYNLSMKAGYSVLRQLDVGVEARIEGDAAQDTYEDFGRAGAFATWRLGDAGLTVAGGVTGGRDGLASPYATLNLFVRY